MSVVETNDFLEIDSLKPIVPQNEGMGVFKLRPYQREAINLTFDAWQKYRTVLMVMATGLGKAQPLSEPVLTPTGWVEMGDISPGDFVITQSGFRTKVKAIFPQGKKLVYRIRFSDGTETRCCSDHLWNVQTKSQKHRTGKYETKKTEDLIGDLRDGSGDSKWFIPLTNPVHFEQREVPIDPYLLGVLLGDGGLRRQIVVSSIDEFILNRVEDTLPESHSMRKSGGCDWVIKANTKIKGRGHVGYLKSTLQSLGLHGKYSHEKHIPGIYLRNSVSVRLSILRGLMDTDGTVNRSDRHAEFTTTSKRLADDVCEIVRSLGGSTCVRERKPTSYTHNGAKRLGRVSYRVRVSLQGICPFLLPRKASLYAGFRKQGQTKAIVAIEPDGFDDCQCISVEDPSGLYLTRDYIVTHNTISFAEISLMWPEDMGRVLILAHREELIDQAAEKVGLHIDIVPSIEMGDRREHHSQMDLYHGNRSKVLVASVQTMMRPKRREKFNPMDFGLIICDEAHHSPARSYREVFEYFLQNPQLRILGVTATPQRADAMAMGDIYHTCSYEMDINAGIQQGWLVDIEMRSVVVEGLDFTRVRTTAGDFNEKDLAKVMGGGERASGELTPLQLEEIQQQERMLHEVVVPTLKEYGGKPTLVFAVDKAHAERLAEVFSRYEGVRAAFITDDTSKEARRDIIRDFKAGHLRILVSVGILLEGFDARVDFIVMARPTKSKTVYIQCVGRGTRPLPNTVDNYDTPEDRKAAIRYSEKTHLVILDFVGNCGNHKLCSIGDILGGDYTQDIIDAAKRKIQDGETKGKTYSEVLEETKEEIEAEREAERKRKLAEKEARERIAREREAIEAERRRLEAERRAQIKADVQYKTEDVTHVQGAVIPDQIGLGMFRGGSSDGQVKFLIMLGVSHEEACRFNRRQAAIVIDKLSKLEGGDWRIRFGKYKGVPLSKAPAHWVSWAEKNVKHDQYGSEFHRNLEIMRNGRS